MDGETPPIRWGVLGAGAIAASVCNDLSLTPGNVVAAVGARDAGRAADFAAPFGARSYGSYADLVADEDVDVVYVATTHPHHRANALLAIEAGKAVLIEKPVALTAAHTREVLGAARAAGVFAMEAMWMRTNPLVRAAYDLLLSGAIGEPRGVRADFGIGRDYPPSHRLYDVANGGGALLDLGIYPVTFAFLMLGKPDFVSVAGALAETGADHTVSMQWSYADGRGAQLWASVPTPSPNRAVILGSEGFIETEGRFHRPSGLLVHRGSHVERLPDPIADQGRGYGPEVAEVARCLRAGLLESPLIPHDDTIAIMELLDDARHRLGVVYPGE